MRGESIPMKIPKNAWRHLSHPIMRLSGIVRNNLLFPSDTEISLQGSRIESSPHVHSMASPAQLLQYLPFLLLQGGRTIVDNTPAGVEEDGLIITEMDFIEYKIVNQKPSHRCIERLLHSVTGNDDVEADLL